MLEMATGSHIQPQETSHLDNTGVSRLKLSLSTLMGPQCSGPIFPPIGKHPGLSTKTNHLSFLEAVSNDRDKAERALLSQDVQ